MVGTYSGEPGVPNRARSKHTNGQQTFGITCYDIGTEVSKDSLGLELNVINHKVYKTEDGQLKIMQIYTKDSEASSAETFCRSNFDKLKL